MGRLGHNYRDFIGLLSGSYNGNYPSENGARGMKALR